MSILKVTFRIVINQTYPMICFQIIDLFLEHDNPEILANKFNNVQGIGEPWSVNSEPIEACLGLANVIKTLVKHKSTYFSTRLCPTR